MSPEILALDDDRAGPLSRVRVWSDSDVDWKVKRAKDVFCPACVRPYSAMSWFDTDVAIVLICPCGEVFKLDAS